MEEPQQPAKKRGLFGSLKDSLATWILVAVMGAGQGVGTMELRNGNANIEKMAETAERLSSEMIKITAAVGHNTETIVKHEARLEKNASDLATLKEEHIRLDGRVEKLEYRSGRQLELIQTAERINREQDQEIIRLQSSARRSRN